MHAIWIILPTLSYTLFTFIRLNFLSLRSFKTSKDINVNSTFLSLNVYNYLYQFYLVVFSLLISLISMYFIYPITSLTQFFINPNLLLVLLVSLLTLISYVYIVLYKNSLILLNFLVIFSLTTLLLLLTNNIFQFYIILEILAYINILFFILFKIYSHTQSNQWLIAAIISFLLNFITSIIFFSFIIIWTWRINYPSWELLTLFKANVFESTLFSLFVLTKLGVGPWLVGNYHSYLGYNLFYLITYTVNMLLIVTPLLFTLYFTIGNNIIILLFLIYVYIYIASTISNVKSLKSLFAYSTVIVYTYLFLISIF